MHWKSSFYVEVEEVALHETFTKLETKKLSPT